MAEGDDGDERERRRRRAALPTAQLLRIAMLLVALAAAVVLKSRCGSAVSTLFKTLDAPADGGGRRD